MAIQKRNITILGAGPAGLATGYYAHKQGMDFTMYEAGPAIGGNCRTEQHGEFRFDMGAHRFHAKDVEVTAEIQQLLGDDLFEVDAPSTIYFQGTYIDFPLSPLNVLKKLGFVTCVRAAWELFLGRMKKIGPNPTFQDFAIAQYGKTLAEYFLLGYSQKVWGRPASNLSPAIGSTRMKGLRFITIIIEALFGSRAKTRHLDGARFYYPRLGYGMITDALARECGRERILTSSPVTRIIHADDVITHIELNGKVMLPVHVLVSTLPISLFIKFLSPAAPDDIVQVSRSLSFRDVLLLHVMLDVPSITDNATIYIPDSHIACTRITEPRNRSKAMSPEGKTSLMIEIPIDRENITLKGQKLIIEQTLTSLIAEHFFRQEDVLDTFTRVIPNAYPILEMNFEHTVTTMQEYLSRFRNLYQTGRNANFSYTHLHDMMQLGKNTISEIIKSDEPL